MADVKEEQEEGQKQKKKEFLKVKIEWDGGIERWKKYQKRIKGSSKWNRKCR